VLCQAQPNGRGPGALTPGTPPRPGFTPAVPGGRLPVDSRQPTRRPCRPSPRRGAGNAADRLRAVRQVGARQRPRPPLAPVWLPCR